MPQWTLFVVVLLLLSRCNLFSVEFVCLGPLSHQSDTHMSFSKHAFMLYIIYIRYVLLHHTSSVSDDINWIRACIINKHSYSCFCVLIGSAGVQLAQVLGLLRADTPGDVGSGGRLRLPHRPVEPGLHVRHPADQSRHQPDAAWRPGVHVWRLHQQEK